MKRIVAPVMLCLLTVPGFSQKCEVKVDAFTNESVLSFEWKRSGIRNLYFESVKGIAVFEFRATELGAIENTVVKGAEVLIKLENGEIIKLTTTNDAKSASSSVTLTESDNMTYSQYYLKMEISKEQLEKLAQSKVTDIRYPDLHGGTKSYDDKKLGNKWQRYVMDGAKCLSSGK